jgi:hypothetical protein
MADGMSEVENRAKPFFSWVFAHNGAFEPHRVLNKLQPILFLKGPLRYHIPHFFV